MNNSSSNIGPCYRYFSSGSSGSSGIISLHLHRILGPFFQWCVGHCRPVLPQNTGPSLVGRKFDWPKPLVWPTVTVWLKAKDWLNKWNRSQANKFEIFWAAPRVAIDYWSKGARGPWFNPNSSEMCFLLKYKVAGKKLRARRSKTVWRQRTQLTLALLPVTIKVLYKHSRKKIYFLCEKS